MELTVIQNFFIIFRGDQLRLTLRLYKKIISYSFCIICFSYLVKIVATLLLEICHLWLRTHEHINSFHFSLISHVICRIFNTQNVTSYSVEISFFWNNGLFILIYFLKYAYK